MIDPAVVLRLTERQQPLLAEAPGVAALTPTERRVLVLVAQGMTNRQIGDAAHPGREDGQEPRHQHPGQAARHPSYAGRAAGGQARRRLRLGGP